MKYGSVVSVECLADVAQRGLREVSAQVDGYLTGANDASCPASADNIFVRNPLEVLNCGLNHLDGDAFFPSADKMVAKKLFHLPL